VNISDPLPPILEGTPIHLALKQEIQASSKKFIKHKMFLSFFKEILYLDLQAPFYA